MRRSRTAFILLGVVLVVFGLGVAAQQYFSLNSIVMNDSESGLTVVGRNIVHSTYKEGFLISNGKEVVRTPELGEKEFFKFKLFERASMKSGYFDVWSDSDQLSRASQRGTFGLKVRLELQSKKIGVLMGDVWFIKSQPR